MSGCSAQSGVVGASAGAPARAYQVNLLARRVRARALTCRLHAVVSYICLCACTPDGQQPKLNQTTTSARARARTTKRAIGCCRRGLPSFGMFVVVVVVVVAAHGYVFCVAMRTLACVCLPTSALLNSAKWRNNNNNNKATRRSASLLLTRAAKCMASDALVRARLIESLLLLCSSGNKRCCCRCCDNASHVIRFACSNHQVRH